MQTHFLIYCYVDLHLNLNRPIQIQIQFQKHNNNKLKNSCIKRRNPLKPHVDCGPVAVHFSKIYITQTKEAAFCLNLSLWPDSHLNSLNKTAISLPNAL